MSRLVFVDGNCLLYTCRYLTARGRGIPAESVLLGPSGHTPPPFESIAVPFFVFLPRLEEYTHELTGPPVAPKIILSWSVPRGGSPWGRPQKRLALYRNTQLLLWSTLERLLPRLLREMLDMEPTLRVAAHGLLAHCTRSATVSGMPLRLLKTPQLALASGKKGSRAGGA